MALHFWHGDVHAQCLEDDDLDLFSPICSHGPTYFLLELEFFLMAISLPLVL